MGKRKRPPKPLPLDDARWRPMQTAAEALENRLGSMPAAITRLEEWMRDDKLPWMRRDVTGNNPELGKPAYWLDHYMDITHSGTLDYWSRSGERPADEPRRWSKILRTDTSVGGLFFIWGPTFDKLLGAPTSARPKRKRPPGAIALARDEVDQAPAAGQVGTKAARKLAGAHRAMGRRHCTRRSAPAKRRHAGGRRAKFFAKTDRVGTEQSQTLAREITRTVARCSLLERGTHP